MGLKNPLIAEALMSDDRRSTHRPEHPIRLELIGVGEAKTRRSFSYARGCITGSSLACGSVWAKQKPGVHFHMQGAVTRVPLWHAAVSARPYRLCVFSVVMPRLRQQNVVEVT